MAAAVADAEALARVTTAADNLVNRLIPLDQFQGSADYVRWHRDLLHLAESAGPDFRAALVTLRAIPEVAHYADASVVLDTAAGAPVLTMPQLCQQALLQVMRTSLQPAGESIKLISTCVHAGGVVAAGAGANIDQALIILDRRWSAAPVPQDSGLIARKLHSLSWPTEVTVDAYNGHFNSAVSLASSIGQNPMGESASEQALRATWWYVLESPTAFSPFCAIAAEARMVTQQADTTIADREAWRAAILKAIMSSHVALGAVSKQGAGRGADVAVRFGALKTGKTLLPSTVLAAPAESGAHRREMPSPYGGKTQRRCPKCPMLPDGTLTIRDSKFRCDVVALREVCHSDRHMAHACLIKNGVPRAVKLQADMLVELRRLYDLYVQGKFEVYSHQPQVASGSSSSRGSGSCYGFSVCCRLGLRLRGRRALWLCCHGWGARRPLVEWKLSCQQMALRCK